MNLPECYCRNQTFQHIPVVIDRLIKQRIYKPLKGLSTSKFIEAMHQHVFSAHVYPLSITLNNCGGQMANKLWRRLCKRRSIRIKFFSAQHPETDSQTENANKMINNYLQAYVSYTQDDWIDHLPIAKFLTNNHINELTRMTLFFANNGFYPCTNTPHSVS